MWNAFICARVLLEDHKCNYVVCNDCRRTVPSDRVKLDSSVLNKKCRHEPHHHLNAEQTPCWCDIMKGKFFPLSRFCILLQVQECGSKRVLLTGIQANVLKIFKSIEIQKNNNRFEHYELQYEGKATNQCDVMHFRGGVMFGDIWSSFDLVDKGLILRVIYFESIK